MNVKILEITPNPIEVLYRAFKICVSACKPTEIELPVINASVGFGNLMSSKLDEEKMIDLIKRHINHESVLEHVNITFAIEGVSRALSHQLVRHRVASYSQQSQRYVKGEYFDFVTPGTIKDNSDALAQYLQMVQKIKSCYIELVHMYGVPQEDARYLLPNACTTNLIMTMNLREFRHFYDERSCVSAQWEIRELANKAMQEVKERIPFADYKAKKCGVSCFECKEDK